MYKYILTLENDEKVEFKHEKRMDLEWRDLFVTIDDGVELFEVVAIEIVEVIKDDNDDND